MRRVELVVIGGGSAGIAAAISAYSNGCRDILLLEKDKELGGILLQCIHNGFGLHRFKEELAGPAYAEKWIDMLEETGVETKVNTTVIDMQYDSRTRFKQITYVNPREGYVTIEAKSVVMSVGCRERAAGNIGIPGARVSGVWSAGTAQKYINMQGYMVGRKVFILGSGDIGLIMARRMTLEGAKVLGVAELMPYSNGLARNIKQCLEDFNIPLYLSHTVTNICGRGRLEGITLSEVDDKLQPIPGTEKEFEVDTLLLSVGLIPDNALLDGMGAKLHPRTKGPVVNEHLETSISGVFACGNGLHVHDLVDFVSMEGEEAGKSAATFAMEGWSYKDDEPVVELKAGDGVGYVLPQSIYTNRVDGNLEIKLRVTRNDRDVNLVLRDGRGIVREARKLRVAPSEMEKLILRAEDLRGKSGEWIMGLEKRG